MYDETCIGHPGRASYAHSPGCHPALRAPCRASAPSFVAARLPMLNRAARSIGSDHPFDRSRAGRSRVIVIMPSHDHPLVGHLHRSSSARGCPGPQPPFLVVLPELHPANDQDPRTIDPSHRQKRRPDRRCPRSLMTRESPPAARRNPRPSLPHDRRLDAIAPRPAAVPVPSSRGRDVRVEPPGLALLAPSRTAWSARLLELGGSHRRHTDPVLPPSLHRAVI